jgi:hypothetical protein
VNLRHLEPGGVYSWEDLGKAFDFAPGYLAAAGGMPVSSATDSLLLITHPDGGKSFDYRDYWDADELIYRGRGKVGHQRLEGPNADVAENRRELFVFEASRPRHLRFLGKARCEEVRWARDRGDDGQMRNVLEFRLVSGRRRAIHCCVRWR